MVEINDIFYVLETEEKKHIFNEEDEAVEELKKVSQKSIENSKILKVDTSNNEWEITQVAWSRIAMKLMEKKKK